ncbi:hypothetical protein PsorP6_001492 [Peronosclerospora sorghi]|uniref:Uncharacterized protein n=1 Tax=Peronosclerospora sorghi TaxID=230839 RepID=A0ACC0WUK3_9STRA|nr:hypothetical protein PsorP6_001492 [Peronosclerospora sorghi]
MRLAAQRLAVFIFAKFEETIGMEMQPGLTNMLKELLVIGLSRNVSTSHSVVSPFAALATRNACSRLAISFAPTGAETRETGTIMRDETPPPARPPLPPRPRGPPDLGTYQDKDDLVVPCVVETDRLQYLIDPTTFVSRLFPAAAGRCNPCRLDLDEIRFLVLHAIRFDRRSDQRHCARRARQTIVATPARMGSTKSSSKLGNVPKRPGYTKANNINQSSRSRFGCSIPRRENSYYSVRSFSVVMPPSC